MASRPRSAGIAKNTLLGVHFSGIARQPRKQRGDKNGRRPREHHKPRAGGGKRKGVLKDWADREKRQKKWGTLLNYFKLSKKKQKQVVEQE